MRARVTTTRHRQNTDLPIPMEAAALYVFAQAANRQVLCFAHVTNSMGQNEQDFEKGEADGTFDAMQVLEAIVEQVSKR